MRNWGAQQRCAQAPRQGLWGQSGAWPGNTQRQAAPVWRAPEGPEGTGGLRGAATNEVRSPSLAGGRARRRPEHQRGYKQQAREPRPRCRWAVAGPGRATHRAPRPIGGRREACGAWPDNEPTRRAKLAARTASGRAGRAGGQAARRPEICRGQQATPQIRRESDTTQHRGAGPQARAPSATTQTLRSTCVPCHSARAARRSRRSSRSPRLRRRAGPRR